MKGFALNHYSRLTFVVAALLLPLLAAPSANALILYGSEKRNTTAPTGAFANSGWDDAGFIGGFNANNDFIINNCTWPVSSNWAMRAYHTTGDGTGDIYMDGVPHHIVQTVHLAGTDVAMSQVDTPFPRYASLYQGSATPGANEMIFGSGFNEKDQPIYTPGTNQIGGWTFKNGSNPYSWGRNQVSDTVDVAIGANTTNTLYATFDKPTLDDGSPNPMSVGADEAMAGFGDSAGGVFLQQDGQWKLAGVIYAIDSGVYYDANGNTPNFGAIFDARGLYGDFPSDPNNPNSAPFRHMIGGSYTVNNEPGISAYSLGFYATNLSHYNDFIDANLHSAVAAPEWGTLALLLLPALGMVTALAARVRR